MSWLTVPRRRLGALPALLQPPADPCAAVKDAEALARAASQGGSAADEAAWRQASAAVDACQRRQLLSPTPVAGLLPFPPPPSSSVPRTPPRQSAPTPAPSPRQPAPPVRRGWIARVSSEPLGAVALGIGALGGLAWLASHALRKTPSTPTTQP